MSLSGKKALVTGGTRGIGAAIASKLLDHGAEVAVTGTAADGSGPDGTGYEAIDFADEAATNEFAGKIACMDLDILVNNAGINKISPFADIDPGDFARIQQVNVNAPFRLCQAVVLGMKAKQSGRIVNICSVWGKIAKAQRGSYTTSKFGLDGMTAALAAEVAEYGILANSVAPGFIDTELTRSVLGEAGAAELAGTVPMKRLGRPEEVAELVVFLVGPLNTYISGQNIAIDGGFTRV